MAWQVNGTPDTLVTPGDIMTISDLVPKKFGVILLHFISSGTCNSVMRFNNDSTNEYANRQSDNGATDGTQGSTNGLTDTGSPAADFFSVNYLCDISDKEKLIIQSQLDPITVGAGTAPNRREQVSKYVPSESTINEIDVVNTQSGSFDTDSNLSELGTD